jgi:predicted secreted protein
MDVRTSYRLAALCAAMLAVALVAGCASPGGGTSGGSAKSEVALTDADNGTTAEVAKDGKVVVSLKGNPTTGYDWLPDGAAPPILRKEGENSYKADSTAIGSPGVLTLTYKAVQTGEGELKLKYMRSFEPTATPQQTWSAKIVVK